MGGLERAPQAPRARRAPALDAGALLDYGSDRRSNDGLAPAQLAAWKTDGRDDPRCGASRQRP